MAESKQQRNSARTYVFSLIAFIAVLAVAILVRGVATPEQPPTPSSVTPPTATFTPASVLTVPELQTAKIRRNFKDRAEYVHVPAGEVTVGSSSDEIDAVVELCEVVTGSSCERSLFTSEEPKHSLYLDDFWIKRTEVTNAEYRLCIVTDNCRELDGDWNNPQYADYPVHVSWEQANDYAIWVGGRLPTEVEWEKSCRGADERMYPWGNELPTEEHGNFTWNLEGTTNVGSYPKGASPYGLYDMAGNVYEWTSSPFIDYPYDPDRETSSTEETRVVRGGTYSSDSSVIRCAARLRAYHNEGADYGFRVILEYESSTP